MLCYVHNIDAGVERHLKSFWGHAEVIWLRGRASRALKVLSWRGQADGKRPKAKTNDRAIMLGSSQAIDRAVQNTTQNTNRVVKATYRS
jgi:hypothetical protein